MRYLKYFRILIVISIFFLIIFPHIKNSYHNIPALFKEANKSFLFILMIFQIGTYLSDGWLSQILLTISGFKLRFRTILKVAILDSIGNQVFPLIGGAAITYFFYRKLKIPSNAIFFLITGFTIFTFLSHFLFFIISLFFLPKSFFYLVPIKIIPFALAAPFLIFIFIILLSISRGEKIIFLLGCFVKLINRIGKNLANQPIVNFDHIKNFMINFRQCFLILFRNKTKIPQAFFAAALYYLSDIATLYFSFLVFGFKPNPALLIFGFTVSLALGALTLMPESPGIMESAMAVVFIGLGFPAHVALFSSLLFRLFSYWLTLPFSLLAYFTQKNERGMINQ